MIKIHIPKAIFKLHKFTTKDKIRKNLEYVEVKQADNNKFIAAVTDGYRLVKVEFYSNDIENIDKIYIHKTTCKEVLSIYKGSKDENFTDNIAILGENLNELKVVAFNQDGKPNKCALDFEYKDDFKFPDWKLVWPKRYSSGKPFGMDLNYIIDFCKYLKSVTGSPYAKMVIESDGMSPAIMSAEDVSRKDINIISIDYLVMPVRL